MNRKATDKQKRHNTWHQLHLQLYAYYLQSFVEVVDVIDGDPCSH